LIVDILEDAAAPMIDDDSGGNREDLLVSAQ
jgi:hypothetical protein